METLKHKIAYLLIALVLFSPSVSLAEFSIGYAQDVWNAQGTSAAILRYDHRETRLGAQAMYWDGPDDTNYSFGVDYDLLPSPVYDLGLGGVYIGEVSEINGTHFNFSIGVGVTLWERLRLQFSHFSNAHRRNNEGWNFFGVMLSL